MQSTAAAPSRRTVTITIGYQELRGDLAVPADAQGLVVLAGANGNDLQNPLQQYVRHALVPAKMGTLIVGLPAEAEESSDPNGVLRSAVDTLARRLVKIADWLQRRPETGALPLGLFGAGTGAAASLIAAAERPTHVAAVVCQGGRHLAGAALSRVIAPTLLIAGSRDRDAVLVNRDAMARMRCEVALELVPRATHLFAERGALEQAASLAARWFARHIGTGWSQQD